MEKLEHELWIVQAVNAALGPMVASLLRALGRPVPPGHPIPDYLVMAALVVFAWTVVCLLVRRHLSVEHPGRVQILLEDGLRAVQAMMQDYVGHKAPRYLAVVVTMFVFILTGNLMGLVPGLKSPTSSINVTLGCALTVVVYYHVQGVREQGLGRYLMTWTLRPALNTRVESLRGASGTGLSISNVARTTIAPSRPSVRSMAVPSSAAGGPPCWACPLQGPRVSSVGM